jgi:VanZ family protein
LPSRVRWGLVLLSAVAIFYLSVLIVPPADPIVPHFELIPLDKWRHFLGYGAFAGTLAYASTDWDAKTWQVALFVLLVTIGYGAGIELVQAGVPDRYFSLLDAYANALGALLAMPYFYLERHVRWRSPAELVG